MTLSHRLLLFVLAAVVSAAAPKPETPTGTNIPGGKTSEPVYSTGGAPVDWASAERSPPPETRLMVRTFADCVVRKHPAEAAAIILQDLPNEDIIKRYSVLRDGKCALEAEKKSSLVRLSFPGDSFRYAIAEALVIPRRPQPLAQMRRAPPLLQRAHGRSGFTPEKWHRTRLPKMSKK